MTTQKARVKEDEKRERGEAKQDSIELCGGVIIPEGKGSWIPIIIIAFSAKKILPSHSSQPNQSKTVIVVLTTGPTTTTLTFPMVKHNCRAKQREREAPLMTSQQRSSDDLITYS